MAYNHSDVITIDTDKMSIQDVAEKITDNDQVSYFVPKFTHNLVYIAEVLDLNLFRVIGICTGRTTARSFIVQIKHKPILVGIYSDSKVLYCQRLAHAKLLESTIGLADIYVSRANKNGIPIVSLWIYWDGKRRTFEDFAMDFEPKDSDIITNISIHMIAILEWICTKITCLLWGIMIILIIDKISM